MTKFGSGKQFWLPSDSLVCLKIGPSLCRVNTVVWQRWCLFDRDFVLAKMADINFLSAQPEGLFQLVQQMCQQWQGVLRPVAYPPNATVQYHNAYLLFHAHRGIGKKYLV